MTQTSTNQRLFSLDALRGFDMFWIMGGEEFIHAMMHATNHPFWVWANTQLSHVAWNGFRFYDLIFPLFLFMSGVSTPYSVGKELEKGADKSLLLRRVIKRGLILVLLGIVYNNGLELHKLSEIRFPSVLGRIGLAYMFACIIYLYANQRFQYVWFVGLMLFYWVIMKLLSAPNFPSGDLSMEGNFASWIDRTILPGRLHKVIHDPEGLFSTIPAISTGLLGIFVGNYLKFNTLPQTQKVARLALFGIGAFCIGTVWDIFFPVNKNLWTSSFTMYVGGISILLLALFYYIIDVLGYQKWAFPFSIIGMNSILIYMSDKFIDWYGTTENFFKWFGQLFPEKFYEAAIFAMLIFLKWLFLWFMYKKKIFLRV